MWVETFIKVERCIVFVIVSGGEFMKMKMSVVFALTVLVLSVSCVSGVNAFEVPEIVLSPDEGFSAFVVAGSNFTHCSAITLSLIHI